MVAGHVAVATTPLDRTTRRTRTRTGIEVDDLTTIMLGAPVSSIVFECAAAGSFEHSNAMALGDGGLEDKVGAMARHDCVNLDTCVKLDTLALCFPFTTIVVIVTRC
jgi:hypothetical protein